MKKILLIDNTFDPPHGSPEIRTQLEAAGAVEIVMVRAPDGEMPLDLSGFDGAVLSGSKTRIDEDAPWIQKEMEVIRQLHAKKIPTLGICYGEQLIAKTLGGPKLTGVAKTMEHGWVEVEQIAGDSVIFAGLAKKFYSYEFHRDEVFSVPANFRVTARSGVCAVQAFDVTDAPMWGVQFHPERGLEEGNRGLDRRLKEDPAYPALNRARADSVFDPNVAATIFRNFLGQVKRGRG